MNELNPEKIEPLYKQLSEHFEVPIIKWEIQDRPQMPKKQLTKFAEDNAAVPLDKLLPEMAKLLPPGIVVDTKEDQDIDIESGTVAFVKSLKFSKAKGRFLKEPTPKIVFFGEPTLNTVMHEFMHYLVYYTRKEKERGD